jgi:hypothetical protein
MGIRAPANVNNLISISFEVICLNSGGGGNTDESGRAKKIAHTGSMIAKIKTIPQCNKSRICLMFRLSLR